MSNIYLEINNLYENKSLQEFFSLLENKYLIENASEKYQNLVNFSKNNEVPYHQWFKYREGFASELITTLIEMSGAKQDEIIIDPFCGSGTTNVVAFNLGYDTLGLDVNPMSALITKAKLTHYPQDDINEALVLLNDCLEYRASKEQSNYLDVKKYFNEKSFNDLISIKNFIDITKDSKAKLILLVAFLCIIEPCSNRKRDGNGLKTVVTKISDVKTYYFNKVNLILEDIIKSQPENSALGMSIYNSAFNLYEEFIWNFSNKAGAIIFSPPYANSFDYFESYKLELVLGGFANNISDIGNLRKKAIRSFVGASKQFESDKYVEMMAEEVQLAIPLKEKLNNKIDARTRKVPNMLKGYFADMFAVIEQCSRCLTKGKKTFIVVDQSSYLGKIVPTDLLFAYYAEQVGFKVNKIIVCRKARTSTQQLNQYPYLKTALRESIVELEKE